MKWESRCHESKSCFQRALLLLLKNKIEMKSKPGLPCLIIFAASRVSPFEKSGRKFLCAWALGRKF